jgi:hypothetical protein
LLIAVAATVLPITSAQAAVTVLDFDYGTAGTPCAFSSENPLREKYAGFGIHFAGPNATDGGAILDQCSAYGVAPHSGSRFLAFNAGATLANGGTATGPETIRFDSVKRVVQIYVSQGAATGTATFTLIGKRGAQTIQTASASTPTSDWVLLKVHARNGFSRVILRASDPNGVWVADDLGIQN